jgi:hypothetical protein
LAGAEAPDGFDEVGVAVGVGLVVAGGAGELALAAGVLPAEASADFLERDFFVLPVSAAEASGLAAPSADVFERDFFVVLGEESAAVELSRASADFFERVFFLAVESASVDAEAASAESLLLFLDRLLWVPASAAELSAALVELSAESADFLDRLFFVVDLLLSAAELSVESAPVLFLERFFLLLEESAAAELSALSALFFFDLDLVLWVALAESEVPCEESSALVFFLDFFLVVVELSL